MPKIDSKSVPARKGSGYPRHSMSLVQSVRGGASAPRVAFAISA